MVRKIDDFSEAFTYYVASWNALETSAKILLMKILGKNARSLAVCTEIGGTTLSNAILAAGRLLDRDDADIKAVEHFVEGFIRLREHRHFCVHGLVATINSETRKRGLAGFRSIVQAKGRLKYTDSPVEPTELRELISAHYAFLDLGMAVGDAIDAGAPLSLQEIPPLPARLVKTLHNLEPRFHQPQS